MIVAGFFILGLIVGSFLNAVIFRLHAGESFVAGRSKCRSCGHTLSSADLVPLFSFLALRGRCRYCKAKLSWQYPLIELLTGLTFILILSKASGQISLVVLSQLVFASAMIVIAVYDFKHFLILDKVVFPFLLVAFVFDLMIDVSASCPVYSFGCRTGGGLLAAALASLFFLAQYVVSSGKWIGFGDVKFGLLLGLLAGWPNIVFLLFAAYVLGAVTGLGMMLMGKKTMSSRLPFGTFLGASAILTLIYGKAVIDWYLNLIRI